MQFKIMIFLAILTFISAVVAGAFFYYKDSQATIADLKQQTESLSEAVNHQKETIAVMENSIKQQNDIRKQMMKDFESAKKDVENLQIKMASHSLTQIANAKSGLLQKKINQATIDVLRCFEVVTGDQILPNEKNNQCPNLFINP